MKTDTQLLNEAYDNMRARKLINEDKFFDGLRNIFARSRHGWV